MLLLLSLIAVIVFLYQLFQRQGITFQIVCMLKITTLQFLYHQHGIFDKMFSAKSTITLEINDEFEYFKLQQKSDTAKILWNTDQIPPIELPPHRKENELNFQLYKDNHYVGRARSYVQFGRNKKDCLDIVNKNFQVVGKLLYEARWLPKSYRQKMITLEQYYRLGKGTNDPNPYTTVGLEKAKQTEQRAKKTRSMTRRQQSMFEYQEQSQEEELISCFSCFSMKRNLSAMDEAELKKLKNYPLMYRESEFELVKDENIYPETIQKPIYYTKRVYKTKQIHL